MKQFLIILTLLFVASCDPIPSREGITLPAMEFGLKVSPDTAYIKLGDTVVLRASIPSTLSNGVKIEEGQAKINLFFGYINEIPVSTFSFEEVEKGNHAQFIEMKGGIEYMKNMNKILNIYALPYGDSIQVEIAFVPLKKGTYGFQVQSLFYEGKKGKTRTVPKFDMPNDHYDELWRIEGDNNERQKYLFAVTD